MRRIIIPILISIVFAQSENEFSPNIHLAGVGGKLSLNFCPSKYGLTPGFGLMAELGTLHKDKSLQVSLDLGLEYWNSNKPESGEIIYWSDIAGYATVRLDIFTRGITPFIGIGLGVNRYKYDYPKNWETYTDETSTNLEPHLNLGVQFPVHEKIIIDGRLKVNPSSNVVSIWVGGIFRIGN